MKQWVAMAVIGAASIIPLQSVQAQSMTSITVPFASGGARELLARTFYQEMAHELGENVIIESRGGAGGAIGTSYVGRSKPDGKNLVMAASSHFVTAALGAKPFYDPIKDFTPVANIGTQSYVMMIDSRLPAKTVQEFIAYAKTKAGDLNYGSAGIGSSTHLAMAYFASVAGIDMLHIPYKSTQEAANDVAGGRVHAVIVPNAGIGAYVQDDRLRIIGVTSSKPSPLLPNVPAIAESGLPSYVFESWFGLLAPAGTPASTVQKINDAVNKAIVLPEVQKRLDAQGVDADPMSVEAFTKIFLEDQKLMTGIVQEAKLSRD
ncbi:MAG: tripartite tricarboxylate transporter substrate-binding protein [Pigmentiphaga sp.]|nr:tripartite tricarboxylate transporter substrate-binding protein [Pigmentiphaga sp.]